MIFWNATRIKLSIENHFRLGDASFTMTGMKPKHMERLAAKVYNKIKRVLGYNDSANDYSPIPNVTLARTKTISLSYGGHLPQPGVVVHGGRVKLAHLGEVWPEQPECFNIMYMVSSAPPSHAEAWIEACKKAGVKLVWNQNGVGYPAWAGERYEEVNIPMRRMLHQMDFVIYQSQFCKDSADRYLGEFNGLSTIIYNCVDTVAFKPATTPLPLTPLKLLVMGSHNQAYRVMIPLEILKLLSQNGLEAKLIIAGRLGWAENAEEELRRRIQELNLEDKVTIYGPYLQEKAPEIYRSAHILIHPKYNDACPTVPIEAMACGLPVVASGSGGVPELLGKDGGITIDAPRSYDTVHLFSPEQGADAVMKILQDYQTLSAKARERAERLFSKEKWIEEHRKVFISVIN